MTNEISNMIADTAEKLLSDHISTDILSRAESRQWPVDLWTALEENGLTIALVPEAMGGIGAGWRVAFFIALAAGRHRAPVPLVETLAGGWLLSRGGIEPPSGPLTLIDEGHDISLEGGALNGNGKAVPWGEKAASIVVTGDTISLARGNDVSADANIAGEPRDNITFDAAPLASAEINHNGDASPVRLAGAVMRSAQIAGGMARALELTVAYAGDRQQFGRPIAKFQAIQQMLAEAAAKCAMARMAAEVAFDTIDDADGDITKAEFEIASAKIVAGEAVERVSDVVHEVHGAIGFTEEHELHFISRRLWSWRGEFGAESFWAERLGRNVLTRGAQNLWPDITGRPEAVS